MLLDIIQDRNNLQVSYWGADGKTHIEIIKIPDEEQFVWLTSSKDKTDSTNVENNPNEEVEIQNG